MNKSPHNVKVRQTLLEDGLVTCKLSHPDGGVNLSPTHTGKHVQPMHAVTQVNNTGMRLDG